jgi:hypothetical protein
MCGTKPSGLESHVGGHMGNYSGSNGYSMQTPKAKRNADYDSGGVYKRASADYPDSY